MNTPTEQLHLLMQLVFEILEEDPIDFEGARVDRNSAVAITCSHVLELYLSIQANPEMSASDKHALWLSVVAKTLVENQVLQARILSGNRGSVADTNIQKNAENETLMLFEKLNIIRGQGTKDA